MILSIMKIDRIKIANYLLIDKVSRILSENIRVRVRMNIHLRSRIILL